MARPFRDPGAPPETVALARENEELRAEVAALRARVETLEANDLAARVAAVSDALEDVRTRAGDYEHARSLEYLRRETTLTAASVRYLGYDVHRIERSLGQFQSAGIAPAYDARVVGPILGRLLARRSR